MFTVSEKGKCVIIFAETKSIVTTKRRCRAMFNKNPPSANAIKKWYRQFWTTGSLIRQKRRDDINNPLDKAVQIQESVEENPSLSVRKRGGMLSIPKSTVHCIMQKILKLKAYKIQILHQIKETDYPLRVNMCQQILNLFRTENNFLDHFIMSDEATFHVNGLVNKHNCRIWGSENPHIYQEYVRDSPKVTVWCAISRRKMYGPFFFAEPTVNSAAYIDMLEQFFFPQLEQDNLIGNVYFQQDGAPPHFALQTQNVLNLTFGNKWIGRGGPITWAPRTPDLTVPDFFLWGYTKDKCYAPLPTNLIELQENIRNVIEAIPQNFLYDAFENFLKRLRKCIEVNGRHFEQYGKLLDD